MGSKSRAPILSCLAFVGLIWILVGLAVVGVMSVWHRNEEPFDDSDMAVVYPGIPDDDNAYLLLSKAAIAATWTDSESASVESMINGSPDPADYPEKFLKANQKALEFVEKALECQQSYGKEESQEETLARKRGAEAVLWAFWHETRRRSGTGEQIELALSVIHLGHALKGNGVPLVTFLRGQRFQSYGYAMLRDILETQDLSVDSAMRSLGEVSAVQHDARLFGDSMRSEYVHLKSTLDEELGSRKWRLGVYNDNATKRTALTEYRLFIDNADTCFRDVVMPPEREKTSTLSMFISGNALGDIMSEILIPPMDGTYVSLAYHRSYNSALQVLLALKVYHMRHGELPESLDALVPEFFDELPRDWFDGVPIKYSREKAIVYCLGPDLEDQGGSDPHEKWRLSEDPSWSIGFALAGS